MTELKSRNQYEEVYGTITTTSGADVWFGVYTGKHEDKFNMAKEYIDREEIVKILNRHSYIANEPPMDTSDDAIVKELYSIKEEIKNTASADVAEVRHGEWYRDGHHLHFNCCNKVLAIIANESDDYSNIVSCPFCGAKMDGKGEQE